MEVENDSWTKIKYIKNKMDELVRFTYKVDLEKIPYHDQEIDRLCNAMNMAMIKPRRNKKERRRIKGPR